MKCKHPRKRCPWACEGYIDACAYELKPNYRPRPGWDTQLTIAISRKLFDGEPSHWEVQAELDGKEIVSGTAPTFYGALDIALDAKTDLEIPEFNFDANNKGEA